VPYSFLLSVTLSEEGRPCSRSTADLNDANAGVLVATLASLAYLATEKAYAARAGAIDGCLVAAATLSPRRRTIYRCRRRRCFAALYRGHISIERRKRRDRRVDGAAVR